MPATPNFFIIGAPKCGTTSLWAALRRHPDVFMPEKKEPHFFDRHYESKGWDWYRGLFDGAEGEEAIGEATPGYSSVWLHPETPERMSRHVPKARLIYAVRHPIRRMESAWRQNVDMGRLPPSHFNSAVRQYLPIVRGSQYFRCLEAYRRHFPDERILIVFLEDLAANEAAVLNQCYEFLGVRSLAEEIGETAPRNRGGGKHLSSALLKDFRGSIAWDLLRRLIPKPVKRVIRGRLEKPIPHPVWDEKTKQWAIDQVEEETRQLLCYAGKPDDFWGFAHVSDH